MCVGHGTEEERQGVITAIGEAFPEMDCMALTLRHAPDGDAEQLRSQAQSLAGGSGSGGGGGAAVGNPLRAGTDAAAGDVAAGGGAAQSSSSAAAAAALPAYGGAERLVHDLTSSTTGHNVRTDGADGVRDILLQVLIPPQQLLETAWHFNCTLWAVHRAV